jgi:putative transposase
MKKIELTDQQMAFAVQQAEAGVAVEEVCRKLGSASRHSIVKKFAGLGVAAVCRLRLLKDKNQKL